MGGGAKRRFILDCDAGTDDAQALMMALARDDVTMTAVTCVFGNTTVDNVARNVLRVLKVCDRLDVSKLVHILKVGVRLQILSMRDV